MPKILIIDDSNFGRRRMQQALAAAGHDVVEAADGAAGLTAVANHQPDCIVTDLLMPVVDGQTFLASLRAQGSKVPVIVVSADIQTTTRQKCMALGISAFLNKPQRMDELLACIGRAVAEAEKGVAACI